jgi:MFS-type transporter involved in bile tolerance (Atg22 family)
MAAFLIIMERMGKAIRNPVRDAMLSHATVDMGRGWGFGFHEAMDQTGAMLEPLIVAAVLYFRGTYQMGFAFLLIPAVLTIGVPLFSRFLYPHPVIWRRRLLNLKPKDCLGFTGFISRQWP